MWYNLPREVILKRIMSYTLNLTTKQISLITEVYKEYEIPHTNNYTLFRAKFKTSTITIFKTQTLLLQGNDLEEIYNEICDLLNISYEKTDKKNDILEAIEFSSIGSDEVGTGDFFGPIVVCATKVDSKDFSFLKSIGVKDSKEINDEKINELAPLLMEKLPHSIHILDNLKFNYLTFKHNINMNRIKAILHNSVLRNLSSKVNSYDEAIIDAFCTEKKYFEYLKDEKNILKNVKLIEKAENKYFSVAAASIIARYIFLKEIDKISEQVGFEIPKGAGPRVDAAIEKIASIKGVKYLYNIGKCNFKNIEKMGL